MILTGYQFYIINKSNITNIRKFVLIIQTYNKTKASLSTIINNKAFNNNAIFRT